MAYNSGLTGKRVAPGSKGNHKWIVGSTSESIKWAHGLSNIPEALSKPFFLERQVFHIIKLIHSPTNIPGPLAACNFSAKSSVCYILCEIR